jgi:hypothetical protein
VTSTIRIQALVLAGLAPLILSMLIAPQLAIAACLPIQAVVALAAAGRGLHPGRQVSLSPCVIARRIDGRPVYLPARMKAG